MLSAMFIAAKSSGSDSYLILIYIVIFGALYFFYLRPRSRRQKAQRQTQRKVEVGRPRADDRWIRGHRRAQRH